jgi:hypothetical protein
MFTKHIKRIAGLLLSLTFVLGYLAVYPNEVSASSRMAEGQIYTISDSDERLEFVPSNTGYYQLESNLGVTVRGYVNESETEWIVPENGRSVAMDKLFDNANIQALYYLEGGRTYFLKSRANAKIAIRHADLWVRTIPNCKEVDAIKGESFDLSVAVNFNFTCEALDFKWHDAGTANANVNSNSITVKFSDIIDENGQFRYGVMDEGTSKPSDLGHSSIDCETTIKYKGVEYVVWTYFSVYGYNSRLSSEAWVKDVGNSYGYCINYKESFGFDYPIFEVANGTPENTTISYQWYKVVYKSATRGERQLDTNFASYVPISGETSNSLWMSSSLLNSLGEPTFYFNSSSGNAWLYTDLVCITTFKKGSEIITRTLPFRLEFMVQLDINSDLTVETDYGSTITLPNDTYNPYDDSNTGTIVEHTKPNGLTFKYTWYNCDSIPENLYSINMNGNFIDVEDKVDNITKLGTGKSFNIDTNNLTVFNEESGRASYVCLGIEPYYNGQKCYCSTFANGYVVFKIQYTPLRITSQSTSFTGQVNDMAELRVEVSGNAKSYQWQYLNKNNEWVNVTVNSAKTSVLQYKLTETVNGKKFRCEITDAFGDKIYSEPATLNIMETFRIISYTSSYEGNVGGTAEFNVEAEGKGLKYQWQVFKDGAWKNTSLTGSTTDTLEVGIIESRNGMLFRCVVKNSSGLKLYTDPATLIVKEKAPEIIKQPKDYSGLVGENATFRVEANGKDLKYQWQVYKSGAWKNTSLTGNTTNTLTVGIIDSRDGMKFRCVIKDSNGKSTTSNTVVLHTKTAPVITKQPVDMSGPVGNSAVFNIAAEGEGLKYQWQVYKSGTWKNTSMNGNTSAILEVPILESRNGMQFRCVVKNADGVSVISDVATLTISDPPVIVSQPSDYTGYVGEIAKFTIEAEGDAAYYQWQVYKNGEWKNTSLTGNTTPTLKVEITDARDGMKFRCDVTNQQGVTVVSDEVSVIVNRGPKITSQPSDFTGNLGGTATFQVKAKGDGLTYQWQVYKNGAWKNTSLTGNSTNTLEAGIIDSRDGMQFRCVIKDANNNKTISDTVTLYVKNTRSVSATAYDIVETDVPETVLDVNEAAETSDDPVTEISVEVTDAQVETVSENVDTEPVVESAENSN